MTRAEVLALIREKGAADAEELRTEAVTGTVTDTEIIDREDAVPDWSIDKDYTTAAAGSPVAYNGQVYGLLIPHNPAYYPDVTPENNRTLWSLKHTTNPAKAKPYMPPVGTSGLYNTNECCTDDEAEPGVVYISAVNNNAYAPHEYMQNWRRAD